MAWLLMHSSVGGHLGCSQFGDSIRKTVTTICVQVFVWTYILIFLMWTTWSGIAMVSDCEEGWAPKNWCFWTVVLEKTPESPLDYKEIQPVHSKGDQSWVFIGRTDAKAETPILWPPHVKSWLIGKDSDADRDCGQEEKGTTEDEMAGRHHWLDGCESEWTPGVGDGQGILACCNSWGRRESDTTEWLNWTENYKNFSSFYFLLKIYLRDKLYSFKKLLHSNVLNG